MEGLGKRFGRRWIFRGVTFSLVSGQCLVVLGHNGAGKSTLLKVVCGLEPASEGVTETPDLRTRVAASTLDSSLYSALSATEHLELAGQLRGVPPRCSEMLARVDLSYAADVWAGQMSTGMRARLKLALALQTDPDLLILDEPGAGLDEAGRALIESVIEEQKGRGAVLIATNDPAERRFATHELLLAG